MLGDNLDSTVHGLKWPAGMISGGKDSEAKT